MSTVIFKTENAVFKFPLKKVEGHLIVPESEYNPDEVFKLLELISIDRDETILNLDDQNYFGYVGLELIGFRKGEVTCKLCGKKYDAGQLKEFVIGCGKNPVDIKQKLKGGFSLIGKGKNPSLFGGNVYKCPVGHILISMETWKT